MQNRILNQLVDDIYRIFIKKLPVGFRPVNLPAKSLLIPLEYLLRLINKRTSDSFNILLPTLRLIGRFNNSVRIHQLRIFAKQEQP